MSVIEVTYLKPLENNVYHVEAIVEASHCVHPATQLDPAEYADGLCQASFILADDESIPSDQDGMCSFLDALELVWHPVDND